jgi:tetratricopeptide (TPR) repeat protein
MPTQCCLTMMLRDESENIERCLHAIESLWHRYVIGIDNKTTDETEAIVRRWMKGREHLGIITHFDWPNGGFAAARNIHLDLAWQHYADICGWCLSVDGDDTLDPRSRPIIQGILDEHPQLPYKSVNSFVYLDEDAFGVPFIFFPRVILIKNDPSCRYVNAAHNVLQVPEQDQLLVENLIVHHNQAARKRTLREGQRIRDNIPHLTRQVEDNPNDTRAWFYRANTKLDSGDLLGAEADYLTYLARSPWPNERYQARLHLAAIRFMAGDPHGAQQHIWAGLQEEDGWCRAEGYMHLADCALAEGRVGEAIHWYSIAGEMPPPVSSMFLNGAIYTYLPHWRLAMLYDKLGVPDRAYQHAQRAYAWRPSPDIAAAVQALECTLQERQASAGQGMPARMPQHALDDGVQMSTKIMPLPEAELDRLINDIPVWSPDAAEHAGEDHA